MQLIQILYYFMINIKLYCNIMIKRYKNIIVISKHMKNIVILGWEDLFNFLQCIILAMIII